MAKAYPMLSSDGHLEVLPDGSDAIVMEGSGPFKVNYIDLRGGRKADNWQPVGVKVENTPGIGPLEDTPMAKHVEAQAKVAVW